jgi:hypothetical protein
LSSTPSTDQASDGRALRKAVFASLLGYPATKAAKRLVDDVYARMTADQREHAQTQANENKLRKAVGAFLADLLVAHSGKRPAHWVYRSMSPRNFTGASVGHSVFVERVVPTLERLGLVRRQKSVAHYGTGFGGGAKTVRGRQWATRFRAQPALLDLSIRHGVAPEDAEDHFDFNHTLPREPLQVRNYGGRLYSTPTAKNYQQLPATPLIAYIRVSVTS